MAQAGEMIDNPVTHDRVIFRVTAQDTNGALLAFDDFLLAGYIRPPEHIHPRQQERFEVISGSLGIRINGREQVLGAGESVAVPPGTPHTIWNAGEGETHLQVEFRPALQTEAFFQTMFALARDGRTDRQGKPGILQFAAGVAAYEMYPSRPPIPLQKALFTVLGPLARALGYRPYPYHGAWIGACLFPVEAQGQGNTKGTSPRFPKQALSQALLSSRCENPETREFVLRDGRGIRTGFLVLIEKCTNNLG